MTWTREFIGSTQVEDDTAINISGPDCLFYSIPADMDYAAAEAGTITVNLPVPSVGTNQDDDGSGHQVKYLIVVFMALRYATDLPWRRDGVNPRAGDTRSYGQFAYLPVDGTVDAAAFTLSMTLTNGSFYSLDTISGPCSGNRGRLTYNGIGGMAAVAVAYRVRSDHAFMLGVVGAAANGADAGGTRSASVTNPGVSNSFLIAAGLTSPLLYFPDVGPGAKEFFPLAAPVGEWTVASSTHTLAPRASLTGGAAIQVFDTDPIAATPETVAYTLGTTVPYTTDSTAPRLDSWVTGMRAGVVEGDILVPPGPPTVEYCPGQPSAAATPGPVRVRTDLGVIIRHHRGEDAVVTATPVPA